jgi:hypothetical protein
MPKVIYRQGIGLIQLPGEGVDLSEAGIMPTNIAQVSLFTTSGGILSYATINDALAAASSGDIVKIPPGTYAESFTIPAGVIVDGVNPNIVTISGATTTGPRVTLSDNLSMLVNVAVTLPSDAVAAIQKSTTGTSFIDNVWIVGASATAHGIQMSGAGQLHVTRCTFIGATCSKCFVGTAGTLVINECGVMLGNVMYGVDISGGTICDMRDFFVGPLSFVTHAIHVEDARLRAFTVFAENASVGLHVAADDHDIDILACRIEGDTNSILVTPGVTTGRLHAIGSHFNESKISMPYSYRTSPNADILLFFQDDSVDLRSHRFWSALSIGHAERGYETLLGEGVPYVRNMVVLTNTSGTTGVWTDITSLVSSSNNTAAAFPSTTTGSALYVGTDLLFSGIRTNVTTIGNVGSGSIDVEFFNGTSWHPLPVMVADEHFPHQQYARNVFVNTGTINTRWDPPSTWTTASLNGHSLYWARFSVATGSIQTIPEINTIKLRPNSARVGETGFIQYFGKAEPTRDLLWHKSIERQLNNSAPGNINVDFTQNITFVGDRNRFSDGAEDGNAGIITVPPGLDTGRSLTFKIGWMPMTSNAGNVNFQLHYTTFNEGDIIDGTRFAATSSIVVPAPGVTHKLVVTDIPFMMPDVLPNQMMALSYRRDARPSNALDTHNGDIIVLYTKAHGTFWF